MATEYNYQTGKITRDWHFAKLGTPCKGSGLPCWIGSDRCEKCKYYRGFYKWTIKCAHPERKDCERAPIEEFNKDFKREAITHYYD